MNNPLNKLTVGTAIKRGVPAVLGIAAGLKVAANRARDRKDTKRWDALNRRLDKITALLKERGNE